MSDNIGDFETGDAGGTQPVKFLAKEPGNG
jgi:hypothetical protein